MKFTQSILFLFLFSLPLLAQTNSVNKLYDELGDDSTIMSLTISKDMIGMLNLDLPKNDKTVDKVVGDIEEIKVAFRKNEGVKPVNQKSIKELTLAHLSKLRYTAIPKPEEFKNQDVEIRVNGFGVSFTECHIVFQDSKSEVLLSFFGNFKTSDIVELAGRLKSYR